MRRSRPSRKYLPTNIAYTKNSATSVNNWVSNLVAYSIDNNESKSEFRKRVYRISDPSSMRMLEKFFDENNIAKGKDIEYRLGVYYDEVIDPYQRSR